MYKNYGIDVGTTFLTVYSFDDGAVALRKRHGGRIYESIKGFFNEIGDNSKITFTGKGAKEIAKRLGVEYIEESTAIAKAVEKTHLLTEGYGKIVDIGGSSLALYTIKDGRITDIVKNALCAAGTGLFLEEQAERLNLDLEKMGELNIENPPMVASRCTVFAKSDLIHHQQEGRSKDEMWAGLCKSLAVSAMNTLFRGEEFQGKIILIGGVSLNKEVVKWFRLNYPKIKWIIPKHAEAFVAQGASYIPGVLKEEMDLNKKETFEAVKKMPALSLIKSKYPVFAMPEIDSDDNEIRIHRDISEHKTIAIGMDIGSTSTKIVALSSIDRQPVFDIYRKTGGDPITAARKLFKVIYRLIDGKGIRVSSFGTTGSGRKLVGEIFGADSIVNEITAHGTGTGTYYPEVETIFEIGGQDAKYIRLENGFVADVNMNYVCAAGTGSFVEEQARKLGYSLYDISRATENVAPPVTSDRCTVFMEQDLRAILKQGFSKQEALASVLYSVIQNYLTRVVGNRAVSRNKVFFQGATARNKGLVAAFENLLGVEVVVSPYCHVMGCIGAAICAEDDIIFSKKRSEFIGEKAIAVEVESRKEICDLCTNVCRINFIKRSDGKEFSWGYMCGRDPEETHRKDIAQYSAFRDRGRIFFNKNEVEGKVKDNIYIINSLTNHTYYPMWQKFFNILGYNTVLSSPSTTRLIKEHSTKLATGDFCFPVKVAIGHTVEVLEKGNLIFQPHFIADKDNLSTAISYYCPYVESNPSVIRSAIERSPYKNKKYISPVIDFRMKLEKNALNIYNEMKDIPGIDKKHVTNAFKEAYAYWQSLVGRMTDRGEQLLKEKLATGKPVFVIVGRPYNIHDKGVNLGIPETIASMGYDVIPIDMLKLDAAPLDKTNYFNMFWNYGQKIITAMKRIRATENLFPIYFSNFNCGPDSFLLTYAEEEMKGKPMLILELDEHDSDGGYLTRIEAFLDVVKGFRRKNKVEPAKTAMPDIYLSSRKADLNGKVWIPPMHNPASRIVAASFRACGYESQSLDIEDREALTLGKKYLRGGECLPMTLTLGAMLKVAQKDKSRRHIIFMPTAEGPCRFGQYNLLEQQVFYNEGYNIEIMSPSSINSYQGMSDELRKYMWHAIMAGDIILKMLCKVRPYEINKGDSDALFERSVTEMEACIEAKKDPLALMKKISERFSQIPKHKDRKPLVGIIGEIYVRCNSYANGDVIGVVEKNGGEAWLSPMHEWILYTAYIQSHIAKNFKFSLVEAGESLLKNLFLFKTERDYYKAAGALLHDRHEPEVKDVVEEGRKYLPIEFVGEALLTLGRTILFARQGADMVVNAAPFGCMPGTITSSILLELKDSCNIPIISQFYDGDLDINDKVAALLKTILMEKEAPVEEE